MWVHLHHIHVHVLPLADFLTRDDITDIDSTFISLIRGVIEEDVLRVLIGLIDQELFASAIHASRGNIAGTIIGDCHGALFLESLNISLE